MLKANEGETACIIMEPVLTDKPREGFLAGVRTLTKKYGALLIFDEVKTIPRFGLGGAQAFFGVIPDLVTVNKGLGNGFPISAVAGERSIMESAIPLRLSATFNVEVLSLVAALTTIRELEKNNGMAQIWKMGQRLITGLESIINEMNMEAEIVGYPPMPFMAFKERRPEVKAAICQTFYQETLKRGVFLHPSHVWFISCSHTDRDIDHTLDVCWDAFKKTKGAIRKKLCR
jgi:glutamate-1-semialdehyde aminotransferase